MASKAPKTEKLEQQAQAPNKAEAPIPTKPEVLNTSKQDRKIKIEKENNPPKRVEGKMRIQ
jgi:hypothetical protein